MVVNRGIDTQILIQYQNYNALKDYTFRLEGCTDVYPLTIEDAGCNSYILFTLNIPCDVVTGDYVFQLLEDETFVYDELITIYDRC